jgi:hypothetical protein
MTRFDSIGGMLKGLPFVKKEKEKRHNYTRAQTNNL